MISAKSLKLFDDPVEVKKGDIIFKKGDPGDVMYAVIEGQVDIIVNKKVVFSVGPEEILGEMAMIENKPRSATAVAKTNTKLVVIDHQRFSILIQQTPSFVINIMKSMADRIRIMNEK